MITFIQEIVSWIHRSDSDRPLIIGISGHGAAGKTTFARQLMMELKRELKTGINYINTDPYIVSSAIRKQTVIDYTYKGKLHRFKMTACHPAAHHIPSLERDISMLREGMDIRTIDTHYSVSEILSAHNKLTIIEGMCVAFAKPELFDLLIYFYTDGDTEFDRRSRRDIEERGADIEYLKQTHNERRIQYELFMHPYSKHFNIIVKSKRDTIAVEKSIL